MIKLHNYSPHRWTGWLRRNVSPKPPHASGTVEVGGKLVRYVLGLKAGADTYHCDFNVDLDPGEQLVFGLAESNPEPQPSMILPRDFDDFFGGGLQIGMQTADLVSVKIDGAALCSHLMTRFGMAVVHFWLRWYPSQPAIAYGEYAVVASDPSVPDMRVKLPDLPVRFGDALTIVPGRASDRIMNANEVLVDGQARTGLVHFVWPRHLTLESFPTVVAETQFGVGGVAIDELWHCGTPTHSHMPQGGRQWFAQNYAESLRRLHTWDRPLMGPNIASSDTGRQEDQFFHPGAEAFTLPGCEWIRLFNAIKLHGERPCNHLEKDGTPLNLNKHPGLLMWDARPYQPITQDMLGKPRSLNPGEARGRWGPDTQHWLTRSLGAAARITGSPVAQFLLRNLATCYLAMRTAVPGWSTSASFSAREWGYEGEFVMQCYHDLEDRELAEIVVSRWRERVQLILKPLMQGGRDYLHSFVDDPRLGTGEWVIAWQESLGAWGIDVACELIEDQGGRDIALRIARRTLAHAWERRGNEWATRAQYPLADPGSAFADGSFNLFAMGLCAQVVLRHDPTDAKAVEIVDYLKSQGDHRWLAPSKA